MKIHYITSAQIPSSWAHSIQVMKMAQAFQKLGHDTELIYANNILSRLTFADAQDIWDFYNITNTFKLKKLPLQLLIKFEKKFAMSKFSFGYLAVKLAKKYKSELIYARHLTAPYWSTKMQLPTIVETHSDPDRSIQKTYLYKAAKNKYFKALVTISDLLASRYIKFGVPENKIIVEQDGVDLSTFQHLNETKMKSLQNSLKPNNQPLALYAGHLYDYKGIPIILKTAKLIPQVTFVLVGGWQADIKRIKNLINKESIKNVILTGAIKNKDIPLYLNIADVLLLPYSANHFQAKTTSPLKLFEYMASGKPIIATRLTNIKKVLVNNKNAILISPDNAPELASSIKKLIENKELSCQLSQQALVDVKKYEWEKRAKRILNFAFSR